MENTEQESVRARERESARLEKLLANADAVAGSAAAAAAAFGGVQDPSANRVVAVVRCVERQ